MLHLPTSLFQSQNTFKNSVDWGAQIFTKSRSYFKILGVSWVNGIPQHGSQFTGLGGGDGYIMIHIYFLHKIKESCLIIIYDPLHTDETSLYRTWPNWSKNVP
jgi:hypothetical protein